MKNIKVIIGANFGDEGKGIMTDYFCSQFPNNEKVLNVRFNGGAQAGHTVVSDNFRHVYKHIGSGSFNNNISTYLTKDFIINPMLLNEEINQINNIGFNLNIYRNPLCLITIPQDMMINQFIENYRNESRHGSCGVGIFETIKRCENNNIFNYLDNKNPFENEKDILLKNLNSINNYYIDRLNDLGLDNLSDYDKNLLKNSDIMESYIDDYFLMKDILLCKNDDIYEKFDNIVFEGAQGLLLDKNNEEYFPNLTPSNTGIKNIKVFLEKHIADNIEICYVTRTYMTRHGAGKFITECTKDKLGDIYDKTNETNQFQGSLRYGYLDIELLNKTIKNDFGNFPIDKVCLSVTHLDQTNNMIPIKDGSYISLNELQQIIGIKVKYYSDSDNTKSVKINTVI